jgi:hypothetical protein
MRAKSDLRPRDGVCARLVPRIEKNFSKAMSFYRNSLLLF